MLTNDRSWKQNKELKRAAKRDREYFGGKAGGDRIQPPPRAHPAGRGRKGDRGRGKGQGRGRGFKPKLSLQQLMRVT
eukprot:5638884-Pyramimonas_sp.AAC.1